MAVDHLAALVRAVSQLRPAGPLDPALVDALAAMLLPTAPADPRRAARPAGDGPVETPRPPSSQVDEPGDPPPTRALPTALSDAPTDPATAKPRRAAQDPLRLVGLASAWAQVAERADLAAPRRSGAGPAPTDAKTLAEAPGPSAPLESLFPANRVRAILRDLATTSRPSGEPDIAAAVRMIARAQPIDALPQRIKTALGHTIVLLFDAGPAMLPFARDKQQLAATALRLLGKDRIRVSDFLGDPLRGVRAQRQVRWEPLRWPGRGSTLVLVSDLGIGERRTAQDTGSELGEDFLDECARRGLRSVALIPYERARWPAAAARFDVALTWDLDSGVQALRRSTRQHRRP